MTVPGEWSPEVTPTSVEPMGPDDRARSTTPAEQLATLRKVAGDWRAGQIGVLGLISVITVFKSGSQVGQLDRCAGIAVGVVTLLSLATACWAVFMLSRVAWGWPSLRLQPGDRILLDLDRVRASVNWINGGVLLTFASVLLLALALAITWYAPVVSSHLVHVDGVDGPTCGEFVAGNPQTVVVSSGKTRTQLDLHRVVAITPVTACP
jgi:hypothetical protein